jgi:drug/metabolite transporter (DMT)-like permease
VTTTAGEPATSTRTELLAAAAALTTVVLWASAFVAIRHVGREFSPGPLALARLLVGTLLLGALQFARRSASWRRPQRRDWPALLICGLLWFGVYNVSLNAAEQRVDAGTASMLVNVGPLLIALLAGLLLGEGFPARVLVGSAVAFAGVLVIGTASSDGRAEIWGVVLCVIAAVGYSIAVVAQKPLLARLPALQVTWLSCTIGLVACLPFTATLVRETGDAQASSVWWLVYLGALPTALAFTTWAYALARTSAGRLGVTTYLVPPIAIGLGWLLLGETPAVLAVAGGALCLIGVTISRHRPRRTGL